MDLMKQKNKLCKTLSFALVALMLCASFMLPVYAHDHVHADEGVTFFFVSENGDVSLVMPMADNCCSNPSITDYKEGHEPRDGFGYCYTYLVHVCSNCGHETRSTAVSSGGCAWWCSLPDYPG